MTSFLTKVLGGVQSDASHRVRLAEDARERTSFCDVDGLVPGAVDGVTNAAQTPLAFAELEPTRFKSRTKHDVAHCPERRRWSAAPSPSTPRWCRGGCRGGCRGCSVLTCPGSATRGRPRLSSGRQSGGSVPRRPPRSWRRRCEAPPTRRRERGILKAALLKPGDGPPEWFRRAGFWEMRFCAEGEDGKARVWTAMRGGGDPGYSDTAKILAEAGVLLASDGGSGPVRRGGVLTPAVAFGDAVLRGLEPHGITYTVDGDEPKGVWFSLPKIAKM